MEYMNDIHDSLQNINEKNIEYVDLFDYPELFYGTLNFSSNKLNFCKFPKETQEEMDEFGPGAVHEMKNLNSSACGVRLRFKTNSERIIFKVKFNRKWSYLKMVNWGSMGFDVYKIINDKYYHRTVFAPTNGKDTFAEIIYENPNSELCIFLPNYNKIEEFYMGIEKGSTIEKVDYPKNKKLPIIFYGNSVTQGAAASRSGNSFPNYVSKMLNRDIINISCSSCCQGNESIADLIGKLNCHTIIVDFTRNANTTEYFKETHEKFYKNIRKYHPDIKIILMTSESFNHWFEYYDFDKIVYETYTNAIENDENVEIVDVRKLFDESEYDLIAIDASHYTDYGMYVVAKKLCELIEK